MPGFLIDLYRVVTLFLSNSVSLWGSLPEFTRVAIALVLCAFFIFNGSRSDRTGVSVTYFFCAFAAFAYIFRLGVHMMQ